MERVKKLVSHLEPVEKSLLLPSKATVTRPYKGKKTGPNEFGGRLVAEALLEQGVKYVFTLTGGHIAPILVGCNQANINVIDVRDEVTTVFAADAQSRISGIPGVAIVTAGPGLTNTITAVKNAQMAESGIIVMGGASSGLLRGRGSLQDIDQFALMRPHVKWCHSISTVASIIPVMRKAFNIAKRGVPGPVFIEFPLDTIWPEDQILESLKSETGNVSLKLDMSSVMSYIGKKYTEYYAYKLFKNAYKRPKNKLNVITTSDEYNNNISNDSISLLLNKLSNCNKPLVVIGSQATLHPKLINNLVNSINSLNIPIYLSGMARGLMGRNHKLQYRHKRGLAISSCDLLILCGVSCDFRLGYGRSINKSAYFVMVNLSSKKLKLNNDLRRKNLTFNCDPCAFLLRLNESKTKFNIKFNFNNWIKWLNKNENNREKDIINTYNKNRSMNNKLLVHPIKCCQILEEVIDSDSFMIADGGDFVGTASYILKPRKALRWLDPGAFGTLGCGAGFAMGVKTLYPNSEVWIIYGDGSFGWSAMEFDTFRRMNLPVIAVIGNDACWSQMYRDQVRLLKDPVATELEYTRYDKVIEGLDCVGILVDKEENLKSSFIKAKQFAKQGKAVVVNVLLTKSTFREGSISL